MQMLTIDANVFFKILHQEHDSAIKVIQKAVFPPCMIVFIMRWRLILTVFLSRLMKSILKNRNNLALSYCCEIGSNLNIKR